MRFLKWLHRWTSLIIVLQLLLWTISGLYFAIVGNADMSGKQYRKDSVEVALSTTQFNISNLDLNVENITKVRSHVVVGLPQVEVHHGEGVSYFDGRTGQTWHTNSDLAEAIANASYIGPGEVTEVIAITSSGELHGWQGQGYRINYNDDLNTRVYIDGTSGTVIEHRNTPWLIGDWMFKLHYMDYSGGRNFNHLLIIIAAAVSLWFALSGLILLLNLLFTGQMRVSFRKVPFAAIVGTERKEISVPGHKTILQTLQQQNIAVASGCGGGGTCGLCTVKATQDAPITTAEKSLLTAEQLAEGCRLACQHQVSKLASVEVEKLCVSKYQLKLVGSKFLTPMLKELRFKVEGEGIEFKAGQYMQFLVPKAKTSTRPHDVPEAFSTEWANINQATFSHGHVRRNYSMATIAGLSQELVFTVRYQPPTNGHKHPGAGSSYMCNMKVGEQIVAEGPYGDFNRNHGPERTLFFIGGGAGMAPLRALIQEELNEESPRQIEFYYGARNKQEIVYAEEFEALNSKGVVNFVPVLSDKKESCDWQGKEGFVHEAVLSYLSGKDLESYDFYVCGPPRMLAAALQMLEELGVEPSRIRYDDFGI